MHLGESSDTLFACRSAPRAGQGRWRPGHVLLPSPEIEAVHRSPNVAH